MDDLERLLVPEYSGETDNTELPESPEAQPDDSETTDFEDSEEETYEEEEEAEEDDVAVEGQDDDSADDRVVPKSQYDNLRVDYTKKAMELADLKRNARQPESQGEAPTNKGSLDSTAPLAGGIRNFIQNQVNSEMSKAMAPLEEERRSLEIQATVVSLAEQYPDDFDKVAPRFIEMLEEDPTVFNSFELSKGVNLIFKAARGEFLEQNAEAKAIYKQQQKTKATTQKRILGDATPTTSPKDGGKTEEQDIKDSILGGASKRGSIFDLE